jgi:hypothetical protein
MWLVDPSVFSFAMTMRSRHVQKWPRARDDSFIPRWSQRGNTFRRADISHFKMGILKYGDEHPFMPVIFVFTKGRIGYVLSRILWTTGHQKISMFVIFLWRFVPQPFQKKSQTCPLSFPDGTSGRHTSRCDVLRRAWRVVFVLFGLRLNPSSRCRLREKMLVGRGDRRHGWSNNHCYLI